MATNDPEVSCGISIFPKTKLWLSFFTKIKWYVAFACLSSVIQGGAHSYYNRTKHIWQDEYGFSEHLADWVIVANELTQGLLAIFIIHFSIKRQRIVWVAGMLSIFAVASFSLLIPELVHPIEQSNSTILEQYESRQTCHKSELPTNDNNLQTSCWTSLFIMFAFQATLGASVVCLYVHSTLYIDDHEATNNAIVLIGIFLAFKQLGTYIGIHLSWVAIATQGTNIFVTTVWNIIIVLLLICSGILSLYPKYLNEAIKFKAIVSSSDTIYKPDLRSNIRSVLKNKAVFLNIISAVFFWSAVGNFNLIENKIMQSKFLIADEIIFHGTFTSHIVSSIVKPILAFIVVILTGILISKFNVKGFYLGMYNSLIPVMLAMICIIYVFLGCNSISLPQLNRNVIRNYCSFDCNCDKTLFEPVCLNEQNYFSPCYAGCKTGGIQDGLKVFTNCSCHFDSIAKSGSCNESCDTQWLIMEIFRTIFTVLAVSILVGHTIINLYCAHYTERPYVLSIQASLIGLVAYGPIRAIYLALISTSCQYYTRKGFTCSLHEASYLSQYIISITVILLLCSSLCSFLVAFSIRKIEIYKTEDYMDLVSPSKSIETTIQDTSLPPKEETPMELAINTEEETPMLNDENITTEVEVHTAESDSNNEKERNKSMHETSL